MATRGQNNWAGPVIFLSSVLGIMAMVTSGCPRPKPKPRYVAAPLPPPGRVERAAAGVGRAVGRMGRGLMRGVFEGATRRDEQR